MWIKNVNDPTARIYSAWMHDIDDIEDVIEDLPGDDPGVVFDGPVQVNGDVGKRLVENNQHIEHHESEDNDS